MQPSAFNKVQLLQAVLDSAAEGIWGVDLDGRCTFVNRAALRMLGFGADELVGRKMHEMIHHHHPDGQSYPATECSVYNVFWHNRPFANQADHLFRKDGSRFSAELSAQPVAVEENVVGAVVTFRDTTLSRQSENALRRSEKLAAVGQLASSIAHEINNPLESVINLLYLVRTASDLTDAQTYVALAEGELARVADITMQTLRFHRQQTAAAPVDLAEMIPAMLRLYGSRFSVRKIELKTRLRPTPRATLLEGDIRQVLNNLVRNAHDAMPQGGPLHVRLRPARCLKSGKPGARITVADSGTGFLPHMRPTIFEPFHTSKEITGTGLGLWISKGIVDKHAGRIQMRSRLQNGKNNAAERGHGTVFTVWLPIEASDAVSLN